MGSLFSKSLAVMKNQFCKTAKDSKFWICAILTVCILVQYLYPLNVSGLKYGTKTTPFLLSVVYADAYISNGLLKILIYLVMVTVFCDAPFVSEQTQYEVVRSGVGAWHLGKILYIWLMSFLYPLFLSAVIFVIVLPTVAFHDLWGSTMRDMADMYGSVLAYTGSLMPPVRVIKMIYPWSAHALTFLISALSNVFIGYVIYLGNLWVNRNGAGVAAAVFIVMVDPIVYYWGIGTHTWLYRISPISWSSIEQWDIVGSREPIPMAYAFAGYLILIAVLGAGIFLVCGKRRNILTAGVQ